MARAQDGGAPRIETGLCIVDVSDVNFPEHHVRVDFLVWFNYPRQPGRRLNPAETARVINATEVDASKPVTRISAGNIHQLVRCSAVIKKNWTINDYPFDDHTVRIYIEDTAASAAVLVPDTANSTLAPNIGVPGWRLEPLSLKSQTKEWPTSLGLPGAGPVTTSRILASFKLIREDRVLGGFGLFLRVFTGVVVSLFIAWLALWVPPHELEVRAGLTVGALFAAVGSQLALSAFLPASSTITLVDAWHLLALAFIAATVCVAVRTYNLYHKGELDVAEGRTMAGKAKEARAIGMNRRSRWAILVTFTLVALVVTATFLLADPATPPHY